MNTTRILKYSLIPGAASTEITCKVRKLLDIQTQKGKPVIWIETADDIPEQTFHIVAVGTGWELPTDIMRDMKYIASVQDSEGFVWHYYRGTK